MPPGLENCRNDPGDQGDADAEQERPVRERGAGEAVEGVLERPTSTTPSC
jgi:hypothetical protein